jgi:hypothetical protein
MTFSAWLDGMVHGVVVQMTAKPFSVGSLRQAEGGGQLFRFGEREADVDRRIALVLVFDFRFGQRRAAIEAPVDRLQAAVDIAFFEQGAERAQFVGLVP